MTSNNDFGFTTRADNFFDSLTEQALAAQETVLREKHENSLIECNRQLTITKQKLELVNQLFSEFLTKLSVNPEHSYIHWPNRIQVVTDLKKKLNDICSSE